MEDKDVIKISILAGVLLGITRIIFYGIFSGFSILQINDFIGIVISTVFWIYVAYWILKRLNKI